MREVDDLEPGKRCHVFGASGSGSKVATGVASPSAIELNFPAHVPFAMAPLIAQAVREVKLFKSPLAAQDDALSVQADSTP